jgi:hypothetical protein
VSHVCRDLNAFFVTNNERRACFEKGTNKILHECNMADGLLEWRGINILDAAPDLTVTQERSKLIHAYLAGTATEAMEHQMALVQDSRQV